MIPPIASRFVAGETPAAALEHTRRTNEDGVGVILNLLGEHYERLERANEDADAYLELIDDIDGSGLDACVSIKPSQVGLDISEQTFRHNYRRIADHAAERDVFLWCDMEDATTTDATLDAFESIAEAHPWNVGLCVQANLRRTADDLDRLLDVPGRLRLVKGAYDESPEIAYTEKERVDEAYRDLLERLFAGRDRGIAVGSHDPELISLATDLHDEHGSTFEIQMLMGVREDAQRDLAAQGYDVLQYAPYGGKWLSYFYRRIRERKENAAFALRAIVSG